MLTPRGDPKYGHGRLQLIDTGTAPRVSPDGRWLAYFRAAKADGGCTDESIVVVDLHDSTQRKIAIGHPDGYSYGGGPWWRTDSRHLIAPITDPGVTGIATVRQLDATAATSLNDAVHINVACGVRIDFSNFPIGVTQDDRMILVDLNTNASPIRSCDLRTGKGRRLITFAVQPERFGWSIAGSGLLFVDRNGVLWRWDGTHATPTRIATGPFQSVAA